MTLPVCEFLALLVDTVMSVVQSMLPDVFVIKFVPRNSVQADVLRLSLTDL